MGKGDGRRPAQVPPKAFEANWNRIFGQQGRSDVDSTAAPEQPTQDSVKQTQ